MYKDTRVVGHVARKISTVAYLFLQKGGAISCVVTGTRRYSYDLPQGGMEIACLLKFRDDNEFCKRCCRAEIKMKTQMLKYQLRSLLQRF